MPAGAEPGRTAARPPLTLLRVPVISPAAELLRTAPAGGSTGAGPEKEQMGRRPLSPGRPASWGARGLEGTCGHWRCFAPFSDTELASPLT